MSTGLQIAILGFDEVEALDLAGPYEVFTTAARTAGRMLDTHPLDADPALKAAAQWQVDCVGRTRQPLRARAGLQLVPTLSFADCPRADLLIVPGGVVDTAARCPETLAWVRQVAASAQLVASVCTGVFILAAAGVARTQRVTTHWEDLDELRRQWPALRVLANQRWVDEGPLVTSAGISAGIDMSLHLVARMAGETLARRTARQMDYGWRELGRT